MQRRFFPFYLTWILFLCPAYVLNVCALSEYMSTGGYILTGSYGGSSTVLLDTMGNVAFQWDHSNLPNKLNGYSCYLLKNGNLLRTAIVPEGTVISSMAPRQGIIEEIDPSGNVVWRHTLANDTFMTHHDIKPMPNGHVLAVSFVLLTKAQMKTAGIDTSLLRGIVGAANQFIFSEKIIEIDPRAAGGPKIVWEWNIHEHVVNGDSAAAHPELFSGSIVISSQLFFTNQWVHLNGLDYNEKLDMILFSSRVFSELYIIDHGTTKQEASGHTGGKRGKGGDILYRWGKPANYKMSGATTINVLHCVNWIPDGYPGAGNIIFFHNNAGPMIPGGGGGGSQSQVIEIKPPMDGNGNFQRSAGQAFGPAQPTWLYAPTSNFSSFAMSSAFRLPNGNTLAHLAYPSSGGMDISGNSVLVEIDQNNQVVWTDTMSIKGEKLESRGASVYNPAKIMYYEKSYPGIQKLLFESSADKNRSQAVPAGSKPSSPIFRRTFGRIDFSDAAGCEVGLFTLQGKPVVLAKPASDKFSFDTGRLPAGMYYVKVTSKNYGIVTGRVDIVR